MTPVVSDLILGELDGGQYYLFYNTSFLVLISTEVWEAFCAQFVHRAGMLIPRSGKDFFIFLFIYFFKIIIIFFNL